MESTLQLPLDVLLVLKTLRTAEYDAYVVGGAVRDVLRNADSDLVLDYDFTTNATPEQIQELFPESYYENEFGTVSITSEALRGQFGLAPVADTPETTEKKRVLDFAQASKIHPSLAPQLARAQQRYQKTSADLPPYQITTYRSETGYSDHRRPNSVSWGSSLSDDLSRRDFTINAIALAVDDVLLQRLDHSAGSGIWHLVTLFDDQYQLQDPFEGQADLENRIIRTVGEPRLRFEEDALRLLRAVRFSVQLGFSLEDETKTALQAQAALLEHVSGERIRDEFLKIICTQEAKRGIELLDETGLLQYILPELQQAKGVQQGGHHTTDVWTHSLDALQACPSQDPIVRLATLLHDIAKPQTAGSNNGTPTFYNHEVVGARMAKNIAQRLRLSNEDCDRMFVLVRYHMFHYQPELTDAAIRRMMRTIQLENIDDMLDLREADRLGSGARKTSWRLEELKQRMIGQLHQPLDVTDLDLTGTDLIQELQLQPGPIIGQLLSQLFDWTIDHPEDNHKELLLARAREIIAAEKTA